MPEKVYNVNVEFRLSNELYKKVSTLSSEHGISQKEFTIASIGLLNAAHDSGFSTKRTRLYLPNEDNPPLPSLRTPDTETSWPAKISVSLAPHLYDPLADYAGENLKSIQDRGRQALRFGTFVLSHVSPLEDESVMFWHSNPLHNVEELVGIPFRTKQ